MRCTPLVAFVAVTCGAALVAGSPRRVAAMAEQALQLTATATLQPHANLQRWQAERKVEKERVRALLAAGVTDPAAYERPGDYSSTSAFLHAWSCWKTALVAVQCSHLRRRLRSPRARCGRNQVRRSTCGARHQLRPASLGHPLRLQLEVSQRQQPWEGAL